jgi:hypothetical protein
LIDLVAFLRFGRALDVAACGGPTDASRVRLLASHSKFSHCVKKKGFPSESPKLEPLIIIWQKNRFSPPPRALLSPSADSREREGGLSLPLTQKL